MIYACVAFAIASFCGMFLETHAAGSKPGIGGILGVVSIFLWAVSVGFSLFFLYQIGVTSVYKNKMRALILCSELWVWGNKREDIDFFVRHISEINDLKRINKKYRSALYFGGKQMKTIDILPCPSCKASTFNDNFREVVGGYKIEHLCKFRVIKSSIVFPTRENAIEVWNNHIKKELSESD